IYDGRAGEPTTWRDAAHVGERDVLGHTLVEYGAEQFAILWNKHHAGANGVARLGDCHRLAVNTDLPACRVGASQCPHQLRAAGADKAGEAKYLTLAHREADVRKTPVGRR